MKKKVKTSSLQCVILSEFVSYFAMDSECLYAANKIIERPVNYQDRLKKLGFKITQYNSLPEIILYSEDKG